MGYCYFDTFNKAEDSRAYRMAREFVHREDSNRRRKKEVMVVTRANIIK